MVGIPLNTSRAIFVGSLVPPYIEARVSLQKRPSQLKMESIHTHVFCRLYCNTLPMHSADHIGNKPLADLLDMQPYRLPGKHSLWPTALRIICEQPLLRLQPSIIASSAAMKACNLDTYKAHIRRSAPFNVFWVPLSGLEVPLGLML